jgi:hypothetical protein
MERESNMKRRRPVVAVLLSLLLVAGGVVWGDNPASAVVATVSSGPTAVPYSGTVQGPKEKVQLSGYVTVTAKTVPDPDLGTPPTVLLRIDVSKITGLGLTSGTTYVTSGNQDLVRPLTDVDVVEITFAFYPSGQILQARSAPASLTLTFDTSSGTLSQAIASASGTLSLEPLAADSSVTSSEPLAVDSVSPDTLSTDTVPAE